MRVIQIGNFGAPYSTENELGRGLTGIGVDVAPIQENHPDAFASVIEALRTGTYGGPDDELGRVDLIIWTRTRWNPPVPDDKPLAMLLAASRHGTPVVGYHLDRWWGLKRESEIATDPFFRSDLLVTADGGNQERWEEAGIDHVWFPPAVDRGQAEASGTPRPEFASEVAFVGSWRPGYHPEWEHRAQLVAFLQRRFGNACRFWPPKNEPAVRGRALGDLYRSVKVVVGDSCLAGGATHYWSDRIPETLGRGGYLLHPVVEGLDEHFRLGEHLDVWAPGDWDGLMGRIESALLEPERIAATAAAGRAHVLTHHTYEVRMSQLLDLLVRRAFLHPGQVAVDA